MVMTELKKTGNLIKHNIFVLIIAKLVLLVLSFMSFYMSIRVIIV
jgi:hypothetical protein